MYRFYCEEEKKTGRQFILTGTDVNHIKNVLRMKPGEKMIVCNGKGKDYYCRIESLETTQIVVNIEEEKRSESELPVRITLCQGLPKK